MIPNTKGEGHEETHDDGDGVCGRRDRFNRAGGGHIERIPLVPPIVDAGTNTDWMVEGAVDLYGFPRVRGKGVDMGCSERQFIDGTMIFVK